MADLGAASWSEVDASNNAVPPDGWPEGMAPSDVNNAARSQMGGEKRWWDRSNATQTTTGTSTAYVLTYAATEAALYNGEETSFVLHVTCGAAPTLNRDGLGAKLLRKFDFGTNAFIAVAAGDFRTNQVLKVRYNLSADRYDVIGFSAGAGVFEVLATNNTWTGTNTFSGATAVPTAAVGDNDTTAASTAFVQAATAKVYIQKFTSTGTYTPHAGMINCIIECVAGGGGGGGVAGDGNAMAGGCGGSGGYSRKLATAADIGASKAVGIGSGGAGGAAGNNDGLNGGDTSVGTLCIAKAGSFGEGMGSLNDTAQGGLGGIVTGAVGDVTAAGTPGASGMYLAGGSGLAWSGNGGSSFFGGGGRGVMVDGATIAGGDASNYGSGGAGAASRTNVASAAGGAGSNGFVVITEYCNQ